MTYAEYLKEKIINLYLNNQKNSNIFNSIELLLLKTIDNELIIPNKELIKNKMMNIRNHSTNQNDSLNKPTI